MDPDFYPVQELLVKGARTDEDAVLLVDVGGSLGHDIEEFHRKHPTALGRLVLQDLPAVIGQIERIDPAIEPTAYDFFTESLSKVCRCLHPDHTAHINPLSTRCSTMCSNHSNLMARRSILKTTSQVPVPTTSTPSSTTGRTMCACRSWRVSPPP